MQIKIIYYHKNQPFSPFDLTIIHATLHRIKTHIPIMSKFHYGHIQVYVCGHVAFLFSPVHLFVILLIVTRSNIIHPLLIVKIPADCFLYTFLKLQARFPS